MLPRLTSTKDRVTMIQDFLGLNKNTRISDQEFASLININNDQSPILAARKKRGYVSTLYRPQGILGGRYLSFVDDNALFYDQSKICDLAETDLERTLVMMGAYLCVFPDGVIYNTYTGELDQIVQENTTKNPPTITLCKQDGTKFDTNNTYTGKTEPTDKTKYWIDTSQDTVVVKMYAESTSAWVSVGTTYVKFEASGIGEGLSAYDAAKFSGVDTKDETTDIYNNWDFNQTNIIYDAGDDYVIVAGLINQVHLNSRNVTVKRELPEMDFVCELDNRLWGCSSKNHEIYACKLGDPKNWYCYAGLDSDSYAATVGTENDFTGIASYNGSILFFKEDGYHKLYGSKPSNYQMNWKSGRGVQPGSHKSIVVVDDYLVYKSRDAVCVYTGSTESISQKLGDMGYYKAVAGVYRSKYYISMRDESFTWHLFVYDFKKGTWVEESSEEILYMAYTNTGMYMIDYKGRLFVVSYEQITTKLWPNFDLFPSMDIFPGDQVSGEIEDEFEWIMETGDLGLESPYEKYIKRINLRMWLATNTNLKIEIMYDSSGAWEQMMEYFATNTRTIELPIVIQRCDHFRLRFSGMGEIKLFSIAKVSEEGSGVNGDS